MPLDSVAPVSCELNAAKIVCGCPSVHVCVCVCAQTRKFSVFSYVCVCEYVYFSHTFCSGEYFSMSVLKVLAHLINLLQPTSLYTLLYGCLTSPNPTMQFELWLNVFFMILFLVCLHNFGCASKLDGTSKLSYSEFALLLAYLHIFNFIYRVSVGVI